jgi:hypothetical protein
VHLGGDTIVVGSPGEDSSATGVDGNQADNSANAAGAAYVFVRNGTTWSQQAYSRPRTPGSRTRSAVMSPSSATRSWSPRAA